MEHCSFPGCPNLKSPKAAKGLCNSHYWQLHKGRELTPLSYRRNVTEPWLREHVNYQGDECLIWPFQRLQGDGRAAVKWRGKQTIAARVMCMLAHGKPPTPEHEAAHSCGKGHLGCVHPGHLSWKTSKENKADMIGHGTAPRGEKQGGHKLTTRQVIAIRESAGARSSVLSARYGVSQSQILRIIRRERWEHV